MNDDPDLRLYRPRSEGADLVIGADAPTPNDDPNLAFYVKAKDGADLEFAGEQPPIVKSITATFAAVNGKAAAVAASARLKLPANMAGAGGKTAGAIASRLRLPAVMVGAASADQVLTLTARLLLPAIASVSATSATSAHALAGYDVNVERGPAMFAASSWLRTAAHRAPDTRVIVPKANRHKREPCASWGGFRKLHQKNTAPQRQIPRYEYQHRPAWGKGQAAQGGFVQCINQLPAFNYQHRPGWRESRPLPNFAVSGFSYPPKLHILHTQRSADSLKQFIKDICLKYKLGNETTFVVCGNWHQGGYPSPGQSIIPVPPIPEPEPDQSIPPTDANLNFWQLRLNNGNLEFARVARHEIPARKCYVITNTAFIVRSRDGVNIPATEVGIELDVDSWAWQFTATIPRLAALALVKNEQLTLHINGHEWHGTVDSWQTARVWNSQEAIISGRSLSAELSPTHVLPGSVFEPNERSIIQLAEQALPENWLLDWQAPDWLIPAATFTAHNQTPIEIVKTLAEAAGAYIRPHATERKLSVLSRYPTAPWLWNEQLMDVQIPPNIIVTTGSERVPGQGGDGVYISGGEQGVTTFVKRTGTAGAALLPMVTNPLITDVSAATALGIIELSRHQPHDLDSIEMPISSDTGLILPGTMIVADGMRGITRSLRVGASSQGKGLVVRQQLTVERHQ